MSSGRRAAAAMAAVLAAVLTGCTQSVALRVESEVPEALVTKLPVTVGVYYSPQLSGHVYREDSEDRPSWTIETGPSQVALFERVLGSMFEHVVPLAQRPAPGVPASGVDGVLVPRIEEVQFATPQETRLEFYEAWIRYGMELLAPDGTTLADWTFAAYGKAPPSSFMSGAEEGLNEAIAVALRDAGAKLTTGFGEVPEVKAWLEGLAEARKRRGG